MPDPVTGIIGGATAIGGIAQGRAAGRAADAQQEASAAGIAEQRRQFDTVTRLLQPYVDAGTPALRQLQALAGAAPVQTDWRSYAESNPEILAAYEAQRGSGRAGIPYGLGEAFIPGFRGQVPGFGGGQTLEQFAQQYYNQNGGDISQFQIDPQQQAIDRIEASPIFQTLARQQEDAILQNASATGGLRGGNTQGALARFRPALLNQFIEQQYGRLAGLASIGQQSAAGVGNAGLQTGSNIADRLAASGAAQAAGIGAQGQVFANTIGNLGGIFAGAIRPPAASGGGF